MAVKPAFGSYSLDASSEAGKCVAVGAMDANGVHPISPDGVYTLEIDSAAGAPAFAYEQGGASPAASVAIPGDLRIGYQAPSGSHYYTPTSWANEIGINGLAGGSAWLHIFRFDTAFVVNDEVTYYDTNSGALFTLWCSAAGTLTVEVNGVATNIAISTSTSVFHYVLVNVDWSAPSYTVTYCEYGGSPTTTAPVSITRSTGTTLTFAHLSTGFVATRGSSFPDVTHGLAAWFDDQLTAAEIARLVADPMPMIGAAAGPTEIDGAPSAGVAEGVGAAAAGIVGRAGGASTGTAEGVGAASGGAVGRDGAPAGGVAASVGAAASGSVVGPGGETSGEAVSVGSASGGAVGRAGAPSTGVGEGVGDAGGGAVARAGAPASGVAASIGAATAGSSSTPAAGGGPKFGLHQFYWGAQWSAEIVSGNLLVHAWHFGAEDWLTGMPLGPGDSLSVDLELTWTGATSPAVIDILPGDGGGAVSNRVDAAGRITFTYTQPSLLNAASLSVRNLPRAAGTVLRKVGQSTLFDPAYIDIIEQCPGGVRLLHAHGTNEYSNPFRGARIRVKSPTAAFDYRFSLVEVETAVYSVSYVSPGGETVTQIRDGIIGAFNGVGAPGVSATAVAADELEVTFPTPAKWIVDRDPDNTPFATFWERLELYNIENRTLWADRPIEPAPDFLGKPDGTVPSVERIAYVTNQLYLEAGVDYVWIPIFTEWSDNYVTEWCNALSALLNPAITVGIEIGNEMWNKAAIFGLGFMHAESIAVQSGFLTAGGIPQLERGAGRLQGSRMALVRASNLNNTHTVEGHIGGFSGNPFAHPDLIGQIIEDGNHVHFDTFAIGPYAQGAAGFAAFDNPASTDQEIFDAIEDDLFDNPESVDWQVRSAHSVLEEAAAGTLAWSQGTIAAPADFKLTFYECGTHYEIGATGLGTTNYRVLQGADSAEFASKMSRLYSAWVADLPRLDRAMWFTDYDRERKVFDGTRRPTMETDPFTPGANAARLAMAAGSGSVAANGVATSVGAAARGIVGRSGTALQGVASSVGAATGGAVGGGGIQGQPAAGVAVSIGTTGAGVVGRAGSAVAGVAEAVGAAAGGAVGRAGAPAGGVAESVGVTSAGLVVSSSGAAGAATSVGDASGGQVGRVGRPASGVAEGEGAAAGGLVGSPGAASGFALSVGAAAQGRIGRRVGPTSGEALSVGAATAGLLGGGTPRGVAASVGSAAGGSVGRRVGGASGSAVSVGSVGASGSSGATWRGQRDLFEDDHDRLAMIEAFGFEVSTADSAFMAIFDSPYAATEWDPTAIGNAETAIWVRDFEAPAEGATVFAIDRTYRIEHAEPDNAGFVRLVLHRVNP